MLKRFVSFLLAAALLLSLAPAVVPTASAAGTENTSYSIKFSKPAICCDVGQRIDLSQCSVQFSADSILIGSGITWTYNGAEVSTFTPDAKGVYELTARYGNHQKKIYVVAKKAEENEYVLYRNDFDSDASGLRVIEQSNGGTVALSGGSYILDGSGHTSAYVRVLLPEFLDAFGDAKIEAGMTMTAAVNNTKWSSLMFRVQNQDYPFYQSCIRYDSTAYDGIELSQRNADYKWEVYEKKDFHRWNVGGYNVSSVTVKGTEAVLNINGYDVLSYANIGFASGAFGFQTRGTRLVIDYVEITLDSNDSVITHSDVTYTKPAIRADIGDTVDLTKCDVQFTVNAIYTSGSSITWKQDGKTITSFTPSEAGVTKLTATASGVTKNIYVVTRNLTDSEYVIYYNDFSSAPSDFRIVQKTGANAYHDGAGHYVIDASSTATSYGRVLLPSWLDEFGDMKLEARYKDTNQYDERCWSSLMGRIQNQNYPYMQMCVRYNSALEDGIELSQRNEQDKWSVKTKATYTEKALGDYNTYSLTMQSNKMYGRIANERVAGFNNAGYVTGGMGLQAKGLKITVDYVKVTLGETTALDDSAVRCAVSKARPAIGCNAGQTILLDQCNVQFVYGAAPVDGSQIVWKKDGQVITEFSDTSYRTHTLTASYAGMTMNVYVVAKKTTMSEYVLYSNDFSTAPLDFRVPEASNGGSCYQLDGTFVLNGSGNANSYVRVLLPSRLDEFGDARIEASIRFTRPVDTTKWGSVMFRAQNGDYPYMQACLRYDGTAANGIEISQKNSNNLWEVYQQVASGAMVPEQYNVVTVDTYRKTSTIYINGAGMIAHNDTPYYNGGWGFQVRGLTMIIDYVRMFFTNNNTDLGLYTVSGNYADVRDPSSGISVAPSLITEVKTKAEFDNLQTSSPAVAIMKFDVVDGADRIVFSDGSVSPEEALIKLGSRIIPAFRVEDSTDVDRMAAFVIGHSLKDVFAVSSDPALVKRAYQKWKYIRGVVDYSSCADFVPEDLRYEALANTARVLILPETATKEAVTAIQDSFSCVWLPVSEGKTASVAATNKGPYGIITPDRALTEQCFKTFYGSNTVVRRVNVIGHRGNPSVAQENTIAGAQSAYANGATAVENDIYLVRDGVLMVMHDKTIDRTTNGSGNTVDFTSTQLKKYVVDYKSDIATQPVPSLEEFFKLVKGNKEQRLVVEIKHPNTAFASELKRLINQYDILDQMVIIAFDANNAVAIRQLLPGVAVGYLNYFTLNDAEAIRYTQTALETLQDYNTVCNPKYAGFGPVSIRELAYRGVTIWPWTINDQTTFDNLMMYGVGGITTNYSQWSKDYVENLTINSSGRVIAKTYGGVNRDVTSSAEFIVIEDTLGISYSNGTVNVPVTHKGGSASYFFRYKTTTPTGHSYYTVTDVVTVQGHGYDVVVTAPTCDKPGYTLHICPMCGDYYTTDQVPATGHTYQDYICVDCGDVQKITVYFDTAVKGWKNANVHYWNEDGDTTTWPGYAMTLVEGTVYSIQIPGNMTSVIFNNGNYQTENLTVPGDGFIHDGYQWVPYGEQFSTAFYVTGDGDVLGNWDADFPQGLMTNLGGGAFSVTFEKVPAGTYEYKITNGTWDLSWGYAGGNCSFTVSALSNVTIKFDVNTTATSVSVDCLHSYEAVITPATCTEDGYTTYTCPCGDVYVGDKVAALGHSYTETVIPATCTQDGLKTSTCKNCGDSYSTTIASVGHQYDNYVCKACGDVLTITVYFDTAIKGWDRVYAYAWNGDDVPVKWPGTAMTHVEGTVYSISIPGSMGSVIFSNGTYQTADQTIPGDGYAYNGYQWVRYGERFTTVFHVAGDGDILGNWDPAFAGGLMTNHGGGIFSVSFAQVPAGTYEYKVTSGTWDPSWGYEEGNFSFNVDAPSNVTVKFDVNNNSTTVDVGCLHSYDAVITAPTCTKAGFTTYTCPCGDSYIADHVDALGHDYVRVTVEPTCTAEGSHTDTCSRCGDKIVESIPAAGHDHNAVVTAPTCTTPGFTTYTCACGDSYVADGVAATGHKYDKYVCTVCGDVINITVYFDTSVKGWNNVNAHYWNAAGDTTKWPGLAMTHVEGTIYSIQLPGNMDSIIFNNGTYQTEDLLIPGDGYAHDGYQWVVYGESFTTSFYVTGDGNALGNWDEAYPDGLMTNLGGGIFSVTFESVPAGTFEYKVTDGTWDHSWGNGDWNFSFTVPAPSAVTVKFDVNTNKTVLDVLCLHSYDAVVTKPTCTENGFTTYTCACGDSYVADQVASLGHSYQANVTHPTCTEIGYTTYTCRICSDSYVADEVQAKGHDYQAVTVPATCTGNGFTTYTCAACGDSYVSDEVAATGHDYHSEITLEPTCTAAGELTYNCANCGDAYTEEIQANGHSYKAVVTAPTCSTPGYTTYTCCVCSDTYTADSVAAMGHSYETVKVDATCTTDGSITETCRTCGDVKQEIIPATGHDYQAVITAPTCTEGGYTTYTCACGDSYIADEVAALGHNYETVTVDPTCTEPGNKTDTCANCGDVISETIPAMGHAYQAVTTAPTCTEGGYTTYTCACGDSYIADEVAALGHSYNTVTVDPTCTEPGSKTHTCANCGDVLTEIIPATGHAYQAVVTAPTCTDNGYTTYTCTCGDSYISDEVAALGHSYETVKIDPTCTEEGSVTNTCRVCGDVQTEILPAAGHRYEIQVTAPTCTEPGYSTYTCACGDTYTADAVAALGHSYETVKVDATCTEDGSITDTCILCGDVRTEIIVSGGHDYDVVIVDPTCTQKGTVTATCSACNEIVTGTIPANGHSFVSGTCEVCGEADPDYVVPVVRPTLSLKYPTVSFEDVIVMNVYYTADNLDNVVEMGLITYSSQVSEWNVDNAQSVIPGYSYAADKKMYVSSTNGIAAKNLGDVMYFAVYAKLSDGSYLYTKLVSYSPEAYAYSQLATGAEDVKPLVVAMLKYGSAAQVFFKHNTDALVDRNLTAEQLALIEDFRADMMDTVDAPSDAKQGTFLKNGGYVNRYPTISFEGAFSINYYYTPSYLPEDGITMYYWNQADYNAAEVLTADNATAAIKMDGTGIGRYSAAVEQIAAKDLDKGVYVAFVYSDGTTAWASGVLSYSIGTYCTVSAEGGTDLAPLAKATAVYGYYAKQTFLKPVN